MRLQAFFAAVQPFLEGREPHAQAVRALWGDAAEAEGARDARRLGIYGRFARLHRLEALGAIYGRVRAELTRAAGEPAWEALVQDYFAAHPMHHAALCENGAALPAFLLAQAARRGLAPFLPELADLEWWLYRTEVAADDPRDAAPDAGPLRLASTVELRPYAFDLPGWLDSLDSLDSQNPLDSLAVPERRPCVAIFWRDGDLDARVAEASPVELALLRAVFEEQPLAAVTAAHGAEDVAATLLDLRAARILLGAP